MKAERWHDAEGSSTMPALDLESSGSYIGEPGAVLSGLVGREYSRFGDAKPGGRKAQSNIELDESRWRRFAR